jgi:hypothetical protein
MEALVVDSRQGIVTCRQIAQAGGMRPFLADLFQPDGVFIIQTSSDAVDDENHQQAKDILESAHDDSFK